MHLLCLQACYGAASKDFIVGSITIKHFLTLEINLLISCEGGPRKGQWNLILTSVNAALCYVITVQDLRSEW